METIVILCLFIPVIYQAMIRKKWYLYLMFAFVPLLPDTFAIELSPNLPLITGSRLLILLNFLICIIRGKTRLYIPKALKRYAVIFLAVQILNLRQGLFGLNSIFITILQQLLVVQVAMVSIENANTFYECIHFMLMGMLVNAIAGILQTTINIDISKVLQLVGMRTEYGLSNRLDLTRAYGFTIGGITFGAYMCLAFFLALFMYEKNNKRYICYAGVFLIAIICSLSRSSLMTVIIVIICMSLTRFRSFWKKYFRYIILIVMGGVVACIISPTIRIIIIEPIKSVAKELGMDLYLSDSFGNNAETGASSRIEQWSLLWYMLKNGNFLLGYGYNAYYRGMLHFYSVFWDTWIKAPAFDVGFAAYFGEWGLIGFVNYILFLYTMFKKGKHYREKGYGYRQAFRYILIAYVILNIFSSIMDCYIIWMLIGLYFSYDRLEKYNPTTTPITGNVQVFGH